MIIFNNIFIMNILLNILHLLSNFSDFPIFIFWPILTLQKVF